MKPRLAGPLEVACFDMDGTLLNSGVFGVRAITSAFESLIAAGRLPGLKQPPAPELIKAQIGKPPSLFYRDLLPAALQERAHELHAQTTRNELAALADGSGGLFDGTLDVLDTLKQRGLRLMLVSNCSQAYLDGVVATFQLTRWLDYAQCVGDHPEAGRNKVSLVGAGLRLLNVRQGVMVGDRIHDGEAALANGLSFIGCTYGYGKSDEFKDAAALIDDIRQLPGLLFSA
ncbi:MAG: Phosphoglycolate phosphatase [Planctomycetes bacterium]|nr:Phosphoglycolate phosphatase [Planctomycetota bacterium]